MCSTVAMQALGRRGYGGQIPCPCKNCDGSHCSPGYVVSCHKMCEGHPEQDGAHWLACWPMVMVCHCCALLGKGKNSLLTLYSHMAEAVSGHEEEDGQLTNSHSMSHWPSP